MIAHMRFLFDFDIYDQWLIYLNLDIYTGSTDFGFSFFCFSEKWLMLENFILYSLAIKMVISGHFDISHKVVLVLRCLILYLIWVVCFINGTHSDRNTDQSNCLFATMELNLA